MLRITFSVSAQQLQWLRAQSKKLGLPLAELLRRIIDAARLGK